ncbi:MAG: hypothetical protein ABIJ34_03295 [archaeon]
MDLRIDTPAPPTERFYEGLNACSHLSAFERFGDVFRQRLDQLYSFGGRMLEEGDNLDDTIKQFLALLDSRYIDIEPFAELDNIGEEAKEFLHNCEESIERTLISFTKHELSMSRYYKTWKTSGDAIQNMWLYVYDNINDGVIDRYRVLIDCLQETNRYAHSIKSSDFLRSVEIYQWEVVFMSVLLGAALNEMSKVKSRKNNYYGRNYYRESAVQVFGTLNKVFDAYIAAYNAVPYYVELSDTLGAFPDHMDSLLEKYPIRKRESPFPYWTAVHQKKLLEQQRQESMQGLLKLMNAYGIKEHKGALLSVDFRI